MTIKPELIKKVKYHFGLNIYESRVWLALLSKSIASVGEVAELSGVPRSRVYDVLESLEKQGFAISKLGKPVKYIAVKPGVVLESMKNNLIREAEEKAKGLTEVKDNPIYKELELLHSRGVKVVQPEDLSSAVKGKKNIYNNLKELIEGTKKSLVFVSTPNALRRKAHFLKPLFQDLKNKGVTIKIAASGTIPADRPKLIALSRDLGIQVRTTKVNGRFCISDGNNVMAIITPDEDNEKDVAIKINSEFFARALGTFLNPIWRER